MEITTREILWVKSLMKELGFQMKLLIPMFCKNLAITYVVFNKIQNSSSGGHIGRQPNDTCQAVRSSCGDTY